MKRYFLFIVMSLVLHTGVALAQAAQSREKSKVEVYMQQVAKGARSNEIDYAYISTGMFKQLLSQLLSIVDDEAKTEIGLDKMFGSTMYMRRFISTGEEGYRMLSTMLRPFLVGEEEDCMGMQLCALNRLDGVVSIIYGNSEDVLVINDNAEANNLTAVFIAGMSYEAFMKMDESVMDLGF